MSCSVKLNGVDAGYQDHIILRNITLDIPTGSIVGISGPNGSGKTTILRVIQGLLTISSGTASILGLELVVPNYRDIRRRTACVFQTSNVDPRMPVSAGEVVMMGRYGRLGLFHRPKPMDIEKVDEALRRVDAQHLAERPFGQLSGGEQQRIHLARALAQELELLLLDEPTTFLDTESQQRVREIVRTVHSEMGLTTIVVSHDADMLSGICETIVMMKSGRVTDVVSSGVFADV